MMEITTKLFALLNAMEPADLDKLPPARRERLAWELYRWAVLAKQGMPNRPGEPKAGILADLQNGRGTELGIGGNGFPKPPR